MAQINFEKANKKELEAELAKTLAENPTQHNRLSSAEHKTLLTCKVVEVANSLGVPKISWKPHKVQIPLIRHKLFAKCCKLQKSLYKNPNQDHLKNEMEKIDGQLKLSYQNTKAQEEAHFISKIKEDPRFFLQIC